MYDSNKGKHSHLQIFCYSNSCRYFEISLKMGSTVLVLGGQAFQTTGKKFVKIELQWVNCWSDWLSDKIKMTQRFQSSFDLCTYINFLIEKCNPKYKNVDGKC